MTHTQVIPSGCGSKLNDRRGEPQVSVHVSTYQGSILNCYWVGSLDFNFLVEINTFPLNPQKVRDSLFATGGPLPATFCILEFFFFAQVLVHVSTCQGNPFWNSGILLSHSQADPENRSSDSQAVVGEAGAGKSDCITTLKLGEGTDAFRMEVDPPKWAPLLFHVGSLKMAGGPFSFFVQSPQMGVSVLRLEPPKRLEFRLVFLFSSRKGHLQKKVHPRSCFKAQAVVNFWVNLVRPVGARTSGKGGLTRCKEVKPHLTLEKSTSHICTYSWWLPAIRFFSPLAF